MARCSRRWLTLVLLAAAGCGGDDPIVVVGSDGGPVDAACERPFCNPLAPPGQQSCPAGQKCTAVILPAGQLLCPESLVMGCVPDGNQPLGASCSWSAPGTGPGHDNCAAGAMCASDAVCRDICGFGGSPADMCTGGLVCFRTPGRFEPAGGGEPFFGVCARPI